jgi:polygalacturonase
LIHRAAGAAGVLARRARPTLRAGPASLVEDGNGLRAGLSGVTRQEFILSKSRETRSNQLMTIPSLLRAGVCTLCLAFAGCASAKIYDVRDFGAKGDGKTLNTTAIQKALDDCAVAGGGTVRFPAGTYLSGPIVMGNKTTLQVDADAVLKATDDFGAFLRSGAEWTGWEGVTNGNQFVPFIGGRNLQNAAIIGPGTIDGSGEKWWVPAEEARIKKSGYTLPRPNLIVLNDCRNLRMADIRLINSPKFHFVPTDCEDVMIEGVTILAPERAANTDGIDPSRCKNVTITRCTIDTGDDNIAVKSGRKVEGREFACENILVTDCVFLHGHGVSIGAETVGGVRNFVVKNCRFDGTENGIRIKSRRDRGGRIEDIVFSDLTMTNVYPALSIAAYYQDSSQAKFPVDDPAQPVTDTTPFFKNIVISNLTATSTKNAGLIVGLPESPAMNIRLENVRIKAETGLTIGNAKGIVLKNVKIESADGKPYFVHNAQVEGLPPSGKP